jgi:hypothetical protein
MLANGVVKCVENLTLNDCVVGLDGEPKRVVGVERGSGDMYRVRQKVAGKEGKLGDDYVVGGESMLVLKFTNVESIFWDYSRWRYRAKYIQNFKICEKSFTCESTKMLEDKGEKLEEAKKFLANLKKDSGYNRGGDIINISVSNYLKLDKQMKKILYVFKEGVEFEHRDVGLDPYMLGLWLGDGTTMGACITNVDDEIIRYIHIYAARNNLRVTKRGECGYYIAGIKVGKGYNTFLNQLNKYNLIGNKHIPYDYLFNTREVRLQVLAGLLDSDGSLDKNSYEIFQKSDKLATDITKLSRSLGFRTSNYKRDKTCVKKDKPNVTKLYNCMHISGTYICDIPCLLKRKKAEKCGKDVNFLVTQFDIERGEVGDGVKFEIEKDGKFLGVDYCVLHDCR